MSDALTIRDRLFGPTERPVARAGDGVAGADGSSNNEDSYAELLSDVVRRVRELSRRPRTAAASRTTRSWRGGPLDALVGAAGQRWRERRRGPLSASSAAPRPPSAVPNPAVLPVVDPAVAPDEWLDLSDQVPAGVESDTTGAARRPDASSAWVVGVDTAGRAAPGTGVAVDDAWIDADVAGDAKPHGPGGSDDAEETPPRRAPFTNLISGVAVEIDLRARPMRPVLPTTPVDHVGEVAGLGEQREVATNVVARGIRFPMAIDDDGGVMLVSASQRVASSVYALLSTAIGSRVMRPDLGCAIWDLTGRRVDAETVASLAAAVRDAIERWVPEATLDAVDVASEPDDPSRVVISVAFRSGSPTVAHTMTYPFRLSSPEEP
jgi:phage baseplate assembly protein W